MLTPFLVCSPAALKGSFLLPDLEDAIMQFDTELREFGPNLQEVRAQLDASATCWVSRKHAMQCIKAELLPDVPRLV
jgi:hypothetical protein